MASGAHNTILIKGDPMRMEFTGADSSLYPGHLVKLGSGGTVTRQSNAGDFCAKIFAVEDDLQGKSKGDAYTTGYKVQCIACRPGDEINARIKSGESIAIGDYLTPHTDGTLKECAAEVESSAYALEDNFPIAMALEALTDSASDFCRVMIL